MKKLFTMYCVCLCTYFKPLLLLLFLKPPFSVNPLLQSIIGLLSGSIWIQAQKEIYIFFLLIKRGCQFVCSSRVDSCRRRELQRGRSGGPSDHTQQDQQQQPPLFPLFSPSYFFFFFQRSPLLIFPLYPAGSNAEYGTTNHSLYNQL